MRPVVESLNAWVELMRGFRGSMWADTFMAFVVQVKVIMNVYKQLGLRATTHY